MKAKLITLTLSMLIPLLPGCKSDPVGNPVDVTELTVSSIHQAYTDGTFTSEDLVKSYIERIEQYDTILNAITVINPDAMARAEELDLEFKRTGKLRPLHGIPLIVKDNINTKGLPTTGGSIALAGFIPDEDAFIIRRLVDAGAIILAKSNMAEWAFSPMHTESSTAGTTHNPYNTDHVPAGSSGGTAAAMAAGFGTVGLGTDTGNSIRGPSSHCSLVGQFLDTDGLVGARIGVLRILSDNNPDPEVSLLFEQALRDMESEGAKIIDPVVIPDFDLLRRNHWCADFRKDIEDYLAEYVKSDTMKSLEDIIRAGTRSDFAASRLESAAGSGTVEERDADQCLDVYSDPGRIAFREAIERVMDSLELDAIVYPTWNNKPARIDRFQEDYLGDNSQVIAPHTGQPAFTVPMGFTEGNLPAGIQFLGRMYDEPTLIRLTFSYEQATLHRRSPQMSATER
ncbi:MAG: amidase [Bacteroidales bacterium]|nr:amidase [Bacteroidales bacterium]